MPQALLPLFPAESTPINELLSFQKREGRVWYFHGCAPVFSHDEKDTASFQMFTSQLVALGRCKQVDIVRAFGVSTISVKRHVKKYREGGAQAFFKPRPSKTCTVWTPDRLKRAQELLHEGQSRQEVAQQLDIKPDTLYRAVRSGRLVECKKKARD
jgi:transposase-like protein